MKQLKFLMVAVYLINGRFILLRVLMMMPAKACMME